MNKSKTITIDTTSDKDIKIKLEQNTDILNVLSLNISTTDIYQNFNSDYGVLIGRVIGNDNIGIPNAKISIFVPLSSTDATNEDIVSIYPYVTPATKNVDGKRYNLLPHVGKADSITGIVAPLQPFGSFPIKEEIVTNNILTTVYKTYYKYTAVTNDSGDYMIFGAPVGTQTVHMSVDITDIGKYSMNPASMVVNMGFSPNLFYDNNTKIKPSTDLNDLPNIETLEVSVNIIPLWGDTINYQIGITRQDFKIKAILQGTFVIFGSSFTDGANSMWSYEMDNATVRNLYAIKHTTSSTIGFLNTDDYGRINVGISSKRTGKVTEKIYYYPSDISDTEIITGSTRSDGSDMKLLDKSEYSSYYSGGAFAFIINCNRRKVITNTAGIEVVVSDDTLGGIYSQFIGFATFEIEDSYAPLNIQDDLGFGAKARAFRYKYKIPQWANLSESFTDTETLETIAWRKQCQIFDSDKYYSVAKFHGMVLNSTMRDGNQSPALGDAYLNHDYINNTHSATTAYNFDGINTYNYMTGIIQTDDAPNYSFFNFANEVLNGGYNFPSNIVLSDSYNPSGTTLPYHYFAGNWLNFSLHFPQFGYCFAGFSQVDHVRSATNFSQDFTIPYFYEDNTQAIAAGDTNTNGFARSDLHYTNFIQINKEDLVKFMNLPTSANTINYTQLSVSGITTTDFMFGFADNLPGLSQNSPPIADVFNSVLVSGCRINSDQSNSTDPNIYLYKGLTPNDDCFNLLAKIGVI